MFLLQLVLVLLICDTSILCIIPLVCSLSDCHDLEVMSSNPSQVELGVGSNSTSALSCKVTGGRVIRAGDSVT